MIVSENTKPTLDEFKLLMQQTDIRLNRIAKTEKDYFKGHGGKKLEKDVYDVLKECAKNTKFEDSIQLISGAKFPDIVAKKYYGVEVKSTEKNHWVSIGSSILESTRITDVERIFLTFGKLGKPVEFLSRPYEECLSDIAVTHYPRYKINMKLAAGETIFDKMGISYDELRILDNPVDPVSKYYTKDLKAGEKLWWATTSEAEIAAPPVVRFWSNLSIKEKDYLAQMAFVLCPEVLKGEYNNYSMWLIMQEGIINPNVRDTFSAGGKKSYCLQGGQKILVPAVYGKLKKYKNEILDLLKSTNGQLLLEYWQEGKLESDRFYQWLRIISKRIHTNIGEYSSLELVKDIFRE